MVLIPVSCTKVLQDMIPTEYTCIHSTILYAQYVEFAPRRYERADARIIRNLFFHFLAIIQRYVIFAIVPNRYYANSRDIRKSYSEDSRQPLLADIIQRTLHAT